MWIAIVLLIFKKVLAQNNVTILDQVDYKYSFPQSWNYSQVLTTSPQQLLWAQAQCLINFTAHIDDDDRLFLQSFQDGMLYYNSSQYESIITKKVDFTSIMQNHSMIQLEIGLIINIDESAEFDITLASDFPENILWTQNSLNMGDGDFIQNLNCSVITYEPSHNMKPNTAITYHNLRATTINVSVTHSCDSLTLYIHCAITNKYSLSSYSGINIWIGYVSMIITPQINNILFNDTQQGQQLKSISLLLQNYQKDINITIPKFNQIDTTNNSNFSLFTNANYTSLIINRVNMNFQYSFCPFGCIGCSPLLLRKKNLINANIAAISVFQQSCCTCENNYTKDDYSRCYLPNLSQNNIIIIQQNLSQVYQSQNTSKVDNTTDEGQQYIYPNTTQNDQMYNTNNTIEYVYTVYCNCSFNSTYLISNLSSFDAIFNVNQTDQSIVQMTQWLTKKVIYRLKFTEGQCLFDQQLVKMTGQIINYLPNLEQMELYLSSANPNNQATLIFQETLQVKDFTLLQFTNIVISLNGSNQGFVNIEFYPGSFSSTFNLLNVLIQGSGDSFLGAKKFSFVLFEFQGIINFVNVKMMNFVTNYSQQFLGFTHSSLFFDDLVASRKIQNFVLNIKNFVISNCYFSETAEIITFPINNIDLRVDQFLIEESTFCQQSKIFKNSENIQLPQRVDNPIRSLNLTNIILNSSQLRDQSNLIIINDFCHTHYSFEITANLQNFYIVNFTQNDQTIMIDSSCQEITWNITNLSVTASTFNDQSIIIKDTAQQSNFEQLISLRLKNVIYQNAFMTSQIKIIDSFFNGDSTLMIISQKDVFIEDLFVQQNEAQGQMPKNSTDNTYSSLMLINSFMKLIYLNKLVFTGIHQQTTVLEIIDSNIELDYLNLTDSCIRNSDFYQQSQIFRTCTQSQNNSCINKINQTCPSIQILNSNFSKITLESLQISNCAPLSITSSRQILLIDIQNTSFQGNKQNGSNYQIQLSSGLKISAAQADLNISFCTFYNNTAIFAQNSLTIISSNKTTIHSCIFSQNNFDQIKNTDIIKGNGGHALIYSGMLQIFNSTFVRGIADTGGALYIVILATQQIIGDNQTTVQIEKCTFKNNTAISRLSQGKGGHIYVEFRVVKSNPDDATFVKFLVNNTIFEYGYADFGSGAIHLIPNVETNISLQIQETEFSYCKGKSAHFLDLSYQLLDKPLKVYWNLTIINSNFTQLNEDEYKNINISNRSCHIDKQSDQNNNTFILLLITYEPVCYTVLHQIQFNYINESSLISSFQVDDMDINGVSINNGFNKYMKYFQIQSSGYIKIFNSQFSSLTSAGVPMSNLTQMFLISDADKFDMNNSNFSNMICNQCHNGTFNLQNVILINITNNTFKNNIAYNGGALYLKYDQNFTGAVTIINNYFVNNSALQNGGAIFILYLCSLNISISNNHLINNTAQVAKYLRIISTHVIINSQSDNKKYNQIYIEGISRSIQVGCLAGSAFSNTTQQCEFCGLGFYNLKNNSAICYKCDITYANSCFNSTIDVRPGFWRAEVNSDNFSTCSHKRNCIGGRGNNLCQIGRTGALCDSCDTLGINQEKIYTKSSENSCIECHNYSFIITRFILMLILIMLTIQIVVFTSLRDILGEISVRYLHLMGIFVGANYNRYLYASVYLKIMTTHFLVLMIAFDMNVGYSDQLSAAVQSLGYPLQQLLYSYDCFRLIAYDIPIVYIRMVTSLILPLIFYSIYVIMKIVQKKVYNHKIQKGTFKVAGIFILIYVQPNMLKQSLGLMFCKSVQGIKYISDDTTQVCYSSLHLSYIYTICSPLILILLLIIPLFIFVLIYNNQNNLLTIKTQFNLGYFTLGYKDEPSINKYWDLIQIYKRMFSVMLFLFFSDKVFNTGLIMIFVILIYIILLKYIKPYKSKHLYHVDSRLSIMQCFIFIVALILERNKDQILATFSMATFFALFNIYSLLFILYFICERLPFELLEFIRIKRTYLIQNYCAQFLKCIQIRKQVDRQRLQYLWRLAYKMTIQKTYSPLSVAVKQKRAFSKMFAKFEMNTFEVSVANEIINENRLINFLQQVQIEAIEASHETQRSFIKRKSQSPKKINGSQLSINQFKVDHSLYQQDL